MMESSTGKPSTVSINTRTAKRKQGVLVFGNIIDIRKDERGVMMYKIKFDDGSTEFVTWSTVWSHQIPVYNQFKDSDTSNGRPVERMMFPKSVALIRLRCHYG